MTKFGRSLWSNAKSEQGSFESASVYCANAIYSAFCAENGTPMFALVRFYRLTRYPELPDDLKPLVTNPTESCWALMGTAGDEPAWASRRTSRNHKISSDRSSPMFAAAYHQIGLDADAPIGTEEQLIIANDGILRHFLVSDAANSALVPDQKDFVVPYGIRSVIGVGCRFLSGASFLMLAFSKTRLTEKDATTFDGMTPFVSTLLAYYDGKGQLWD